MPFAAAPRRLYHSLRRFEVSPGRGIARKMEPPPQPLLNQTRLFTAEKLMRNYGVFPTIGLICIAICGYVGFASYALATREAWWVRGKDPWEKVDVMNPQPQKLIRIVKEYPPLEELHEVLTDMERGVCGESH